MAIQAQQLRVDDLPVRSIRALPHRHKEHRAFSEDMRTCTHCGKTASFHRAGPGGWVTCNACGALA
jgi:ribosomal protein L37AE/L43A